MLILANGTMQHRLTDPQLREINAWFGPMIDGGFLHTGYVDESRQKLWLILSCDTMAEAHQRLDDLPTVRNDAMRSPIACAPDTPPRSSSEPTKASTKAARSMPSYAASTSRRT